MISSQETIETLYSEPQRKAKRMENMEANKNTRPDWDSWLMGMCCVAATRSLDTSTAHGAVICDSNHRPKGTGYNGFPRNCDDSFFPSTRPLKYDITIHAEENCLLNSENLLVGSDYTIYVTGLPCSRCFIKIMQYDIRRVVYGNVISHCVDENQSKLVFKLAVMRKIQLDKFNKFDCRKYINTIREMLSSSGENCE